MGLKRTAFPASEPITEDDLRAQSRYEGSAEIDYLVGLGVAARERLEEELERSLLTQTWELTLDGWPTSGVITLARPPVIEVASVTYLDTSGNRQTLASNLYRVIIDELPGRIVPEYNATWPQCRAVPGSVVVAFDAGYGSDAEDVPKPLRDAICQAAAWWFDNRGADDLPGGALAMARPWRWRV